MALLRLNNNYQLLETFSHPLSFQGCRECHMCCDGSVFHFAPLLLDDCSEVAPYFPLFLAKIENNLRLVMLYGREACFYFSSYGCMIYSHRPPACQSYPLSPFFDKIVVDTTCHALGDEGELLWNQDYTLCSRFKTRRLENFATKYYETLKILEEQYTSHLKWKIRLFNIDLYGLEGKSQLAYTLHNSWQKFSFLRD